MVNKTGKLSRKGFTFIEILVSIAILAIGVAIAGGFIHVASKGTTKTVELDTARGEVLESIYKNTAGGTKTQLNITFECFEGENSFSYRPSEVYMHTVRDSGTGIEYKYFKKE